MLAVFPTSRHPLIDHTSDLDSAACLGSDVIHPVPLEVNSANCNDLPEHQLAEIISNAPILDSCFQVRLLSHDLIAKFGLNVTLQEFVNQRHAWVTLANTSLRIPKVYRFFQHAGKDGITQGYLLMERIIGRTLEDSLPDLEPEDIVERLAATIEEMQTKSKSSARNPGPIFGCGSGFPWGMSLGRHAFWSIHDLEDCLNRTLVKDTKWKSKLLLRDFSCVLVHGELLPRNLMITDTDQIAVLDWSTMAYYPKVFEAASLRFHLESLPEEHEKVIENAVARLCQSQDLDEELMCALVRVQGLGIRYPYIHDADTGVSRAYSVQDGLELGQSDN